MAKQVLGEVVKEEKAESCRDRGSPELPEWIRRIKEKKYIPSGDIDSFHLFFV